MYKFIQKFLSKYKLRTVAFMVVNIILSVFSIILTIINGEIINTLVNKSMQGLYNFCIILAALTLLSVIFNYFMNVINARLKNYLTIDVITYILNHIKKLSYMFIERKDTSYLSQRINTDAGIVITFVLNLISSAVVNVVTIAIILVFFFTVSIKMAIILITLLGLYILIYMGFRQNLFVKGMAFQELLSQFFSKINELLKNIQFIKTHEQSAYFDNKLSNIFKQMHGKSISYTRASYFYTSSETIITTCAKVIIFIIAGIQVIKGNLTVGYFSILTNYFSLLLSSVKYFFNIGKSHQEALVSYKRLKEILDIPLQQDGNSVINSIDKISLKNLSFKYGSKDIFINYNLDLVKGNIYGFRGGNGSGKSTLIKLIIGLYAMEYDGVIEYNNTDIKSLNMAKIRSELVSFVEQEPILINDTVYNNMLFCSQNEINLEEYISILNLHNFINKNPEGLNTMIDSQSNNLSGGEKQKITIIRELLKKSDLMIFDEPTSAMDIASTDAFFYHLQHIKSDKIIILILHDKNIENYCDNIIDFEVLRS